MRLKLAMTSKVEGPVVFLAGGGGGGGAGQGFVFGVCFKRVWGLYALGARGCGFSRSIQVSGLWVWGFQDVLQARCNVSRSQELSPNPEP